MFICPVCGYDKLNEEPYDDDGNPSYEICNCCGFEFGYDEGKDFANYQEKWIKNGAVWFNTQVKPIDWDLNKQLANLRNTV